MAHRVLDRVQESTVSSGSGALTLGGAALRMFSFAGAGFADGDTFWGLIEHQDANEWELALCTYNSAGGTIARATPPVKSSSGATVAFSPGTKTITLVQPAVSGVVLPSRIVTAGPTVSMANSDYEIIVKQTVSAPIRVIFPPAPLVNQIVVVSDGKGDLDVGANNITLQPFVGTINGQATLVMQAAYQSVKARYSGIEWNTI